jgi:ElaB/YqjD/DUF883 family membrane-anchored ribosome-binding protein
MQMPQSTRTIERVKDGVGGLVEKARDVVNDSLDSAQERLENGAVALARGYRKLSTTAQLISQGAREQLESASDALRDGCGQAKKNLSRLKRDASEYVSDNPGKSLLMAAGLGFLLGMAVRRHRDT